MSLVTLLDCSWCSVEHAAVLTVSVEPQMMFVRTQVLCSNCGVAGKTHSHMLSGAEDGRSVYFPAEVERAASLAVDAWRDMAS